MQRTQTVSLTITISVSFLDWNRLVSAGFLMIYYRLTRSWRLCIRTVFTSDPLPDWTATILVAMSVREPVMGQTQHRNLQRGLMVIIEF